MNGRAGVGYFTAVGTHTHTHAYIQYTRQHTNSAFSHLFRACETHTRMDSMHSPLHTLSLTHSSGLSVQVNKVNRICD